MSVARSQSESEPDVILDVEYKVTHVKLALQSCNWRYGGHTYHLD